MRSPKRSLFLRFLPGRLWRRSRGWGRWVRWPPTLSMSSRGRPRIGLRTCAGGLPLEVIFKSLCLLNQSKTIISVPLQCQLANKFDLLMIENGYKPNLKLDCLKIWLFITGLTAEIATSASLVTLVWVGTMCELLNKTSPQGGNLGSAGQTVGELQGNREIFLNP